MHETDTIALLPHSLGTERQLTVHRFGTPGASPKVYVQGGLHANELAGPLTAHHLTCLLSAADARGEVIGDITTIPLANPIGASQFVLTSHLGRYDTAMGGNFNRGFDDVSPQVEAAVGDALGTDETANKSIIAKSIAGALGAVDANTETARLQLALLRQACGADIVLDLHTDSEAEMHLYIDPDQWPSASDLAAQLDAAVVMLSRASGGTPFEETCAAPWIALRERHGAAHIPLPLTCVVELRGVADAFDELAGADAANIYKFLQRRGAIAGDPGPCPEGSFIAAPFEATSIVRAPCPGVIAYHVEMGTMVKKGDLIAEIVDVTQDELSDARTPVVAEIDGRLFTRSLNKLARPGLPIGKIQGTEVISSRTGYLLTD
jgi:hypothetical protein